MKILIIEDDATLGACIVGYIIARFHASYKLARSCKEAREYLNSDEFDVITLDGTLLDGHGRSILNEMTADERLQTVVYSGEIDFIQEAKSIGVSALIKGDCNQLVSEISKIIYSETKKVG